jgi:hypothetical protein
MTLSSPSGGWPAGAFQSSSISYWNESFSRPNSSIVKQVRPRVEAHVKLCHSRGVVDLDTL